jgi:hypothetical protein
MDSYLSKAGDAEDSNQLSEAIRSYVTVLALAEESPSSDAKSRTDAAQAALSRIGTSLSLEPGSEWVAPNGSQIAGGARNLGKDGGLSPSVYLYQSFGSGKSPVADAPIFFQFVKNAGSLVSFVTTDTYGKANTTVASVDQAGSEALIRACPVFKARGKSYMFQSVYRDFAYLPPANIIKVMALESSELGPGGKASTVDPVASALKEAGFEVQIEEARPDDANFRKAYAGDVKALAALGIDASAPYAAFVLVDVAGAKQMELNGKKYNIFTAAATVNIRLLRSDGSVAFSLPVDGVKGQGASSEAAVQDAFKRAGDSVGPELRRRMQDLQDALAKG